MRTTLQIDDDVLEAAKAMAEAARTTVGAVVSDLARKSLRKAVVQPERRNGILLLPIKEPGRIVTMEMVNALRDTEDFDLPA